MLLLSLAYLLIAVVSPVLLWPDTDVKEFTLHIQRTQLNPDCFHQSYSAFHVNGQFPAPLIRVVRGDRVRLIVENDASNNVSTAIHIHGIYQYYSNHADGVPEINQVAIRPGKRFVQEFRVINQTGTFFYHAHVATQDDSVQGPFIVYDSQASLEGKTSDGPYPYDHEHILQWSDWWHQSLDDRAAYYMSPNFGNDQGPDSVLLNGQGVYPNATITKDCKGYRYFDVLPNRLYRLRNIGGMTFRDIEISIKDHGMQLIEIDGEYVKPYNLSSIVMGPGQRMSVLVRTGNHPPGSLFPILTQYRWRQDALNPGYTQSGYGYLRYVDPQDDCKNHPEEKTDGPKHEKDTIRLLERPETPTYNASAQVPGWVLPYIKPWKQPSSSILTAKADRTILISMHDIRLPDGSRRFVNDGRPYNRHPWGNASVSLLDMVQKDPEVGTLDRHDGYSSRHRTYPLKLNQIVDLVFQNYFLPPPAPPKLCVLHPWHTHGYSHYLMAEGPGDYDPVAHKDLVTFDTPLYKDVSVVYPVPKNKSKGCGWTKIRIFTNNPGVWAVHCHITAHMMQGKMIVLEVAPEELTSKKEETISDDSC
ncbi:Cupredoxin [Choanephora cucurbitarum]|nr:Cupredoxin [Choanephora cucurbitarum]